MTGSKNGAEIRKLMANKDGSRHTYYHRYTGKNFSEVLNGCRIEAAKKLLAEPGLRIADIAEEVGFADTAHFSRVFKKLTGVSANEYRNSL